MIHLPPPPPPEKVAQIHSLFFFPSSIGRSLPLTFSPALRSFAASYFSSHVCAQQNGEKVHNGWGKETQKWKRVRALDQHREIRVFDVFSGIDTFPQRCALLTFSEKVHDTTANFTTLYSTL